ncbi:hypothetical protein ENBRE01_0974 [Enteropsectra breve]|nr:hypothetical protein ENBRE01_0974 [Enteropsectra breve]
MLQNHTEIEMLRNYRRPDDLEDTSILNENPTPLYLFRELTAAEENAINCSIDSNKKERNIAAKRSSKPAKAYENGSNSGYFDDAGNFILHKMEAVPVQWLLKKGEAVAGPLSEQELVAEIEKNGLAGAMIKRTFDKGFVCAESLQKEIPDFYHNKSLNHYFVTHQKVEKVERNDEFYCDVASTVKSTKLMNFLKSNSINASAEFIISSFKGMSKERAIDAISGITGLDKVKNTMLIELLVEESDVQILSDVDKDGYTIKKKHLNFKKTK